VGTGESEVANATLFKKEKRKPKEGESILGRTFLYQFLGTEIMDGGIYVEGVAVRLGTFSFREATTESVVDGGERLNQWRFNVRGLRGPI